MGMQVALQFLSAHWLALLIVAAVLAAFALVQVWARYRYGPKDIIGNGITIGHANPDYSRKSPTDIPRTAVK